MAVSGAPSPPPLRNPAGSTTDLPLGPLAQSGMGNPFFYHQFQDDFDALLGATGIYTLSGTGSAAHTAGDGGLALLSTLASQPTFASIQLPAASFTLPGTGSAPPGTSLSIKKLFYLTRIQLSVVTLSAFFAGLVNTTATPFSAGIVDGIYFSKTASSTVLNFSIIASAGNSPTGSAVAGSITIPTTAYALANATFIDLGFSIDRRQNISVYVGNPLVGYFPQSGSGAVSSTTGLTVNPGRGPVTSLQQDITPTALTTANLTPILAVSNGVTAAIKTMTVDFHCVQKER